MDRTAADAMSRAICDTSEPRGDTVTDRPRPVYKPVRFGRLLTGAMANPEFFDQVHVVFGGTGAVGGETVFQIMRMFDDVVRRSRSKPERAPHIVVTGHTRREIRQFTRTLFGLHERDHGREPDRLEGVGYRTASGVVIELRTLSVEPSIPEMKNASRLSDAELAAAVSAFRRRVGITADAGVEAHVRALEKTIEEEGAHPFTNFLRAFMEKRERPGVGGTFRSVVVTIPLASVATYQLGNLETFAKALGIEEAKTLSAVKEVYLSAFPNDLAHVAESLADEVLVGHTTGVGGMYDVVDGESIIRIGFAHSALGAKLRTKQDFAEKLADAYSQRGIRILVTAAAIGIDAVLHKKVPPIQNAIRAKLEMAARDGAQIVPESDLTAGSLRVYPPSYGDVHDRGEAPNELTRGTPLVFEYAVRSGENGFLTVANADALYRVMRVASSSELGLILARTAVFGDDPQSPAFVDNVCYYTETDNSRQVLDLLGQPSLRFDQMSGLRPKALQDLGSSKHQAEMHTLGLLILLSRLKSLDLGGIPPRVKLDEFDPLDYFDRHSRAPRLDDVLAWDARTLSEELTALVTAETEEDLARFQHVNQPYPERQEAVHRVLQAVLRAVWAIPSLGTPLLFASEGRLRAAFGYYVAPLDVVATRTGTIGRTLSSAYETQAGHAAKVGDAAFDRFCEFHFANGFADLRAQATLVTARATSEKLDEKVHVFEDEAAFIEALDALEPYTYFTTSGLLALLVRLKALAQRAAELNLELGSANEFRAHFVRDEQERALLMPGVVEAFRMVSEGLEKNTGSERLDGYWGYGH